MRLVAMPADADPDIVFGAKHLPDPGRWPAKRLDLLADRIQPIRDRFGLLQSPQRVIIPDPERRPPPLAFILPKLKRLQRQGRGARNEILLGSWRDELGGVPQPLGFAGRACKKRKLLGQAGGPFDNGWNFRDIGSQLANEKAARRGPSGLQSALIRLNPAQRYSCVTPRLRSHDDLCPCRLAAACRAAPERAAIFGDFQSGPDRLLCAARAVFSRAAAGAAGARADRGSYETGTAPAPGGGGGDPPVWPAAGLFALTREHAAGLTKSLCMAGKRFDSWPRHA